MVQQYVGGQIPMPVTGQMASELIRSLWRLHTANIIHGDPRVPNAVIVNEKVRWVDFLPFFAHGNEGDFLKSYRRDMCILVASILLTDKSSASLVVESYVSSDETTLDGIMESVTYTRTAST